PCRRRHAGADRRSGRSGGGGSLRGLPAGPSARLVAGRPGGGSPAAARHAGKPADRLCCGGGGQRPDGGMGGARPGPRPGVRTAARHPVRSLLTAGLLASAAFLLVGVESFRRSAGEDYLRRDSGSGGFALLAESDLPVYVDLNSERGRDELIDKLESQWEQ